MLIEEIRILTEEKTIQVVWSNTDSNIVYAFLETYEVISYDILQEVPTSCVSIEAEIIRKEESVLMVLSNDDRYLFIANKYGQNGMVLDLKKKKKVLEIDRKSYHTEQTIFPALFAEIEEQTYFIGATDWNHLDIFDLQTYEVRTNRSNKYGDEYYLDYFYGQLHLSPDNRVLLSSGWGWSPISVIKLIDLREWLTVNVHEPELDSGLYHSVLSYYWDRALCWVSNTRFAMLYNPLEEDLDDDEYEQMQVKKSQKYILIYDVSEQDVVKRIVFEDFSTNQYHEATADCRLFYSENSIIASCKELGTSIINVETGRVEARYSKIYLSDKAPGINYLFSFTDEKSITLFRWVN